MSKKLVPLNIGINADSSFFPVIQEIKTVLDTARYNVAKQVNKELIQAYWSIGKIIC